MEKKSRLLTIGQFAALHGINRKTLMWYDQIGLFQPAYIHPENGYRYYSYYQSSILETILLLRELDVSIDEIQEFMHSRSAASLDALKSMRRLRSWSAPWPTCGRSGRHLSTTAGTCRRC